MSLSGHQSAKMKSDTYLTPPDIVQQLGPFDLDPCCPPKMPWKTAEMTYTKVQDGLKQPWRGRVWMNPPFGPSTGKWFERLAGHNDGIGLCAARTETQWWFESIWSKATALLFLQTRPHFHFADGTRAPFNSGAPIVLVAYGERNAKALRVGGIHGAYLPLASIRFLDKDDPISIVAQNAMYDVRDKLTPLK